MGRLACSVATESVTATWQTVCSSPVRRRLVPWHAAGEGRAGWAGAAPPAEETSHAGGRRGLRRPGRVEAEGLGGPGRGGARRRGALPRRGREHPRGDRAVGGEARETAPAARLLLRGRPDRLR